MVGEAGSLEEVHSQAGEVVVRRDGDVILRTVDRGKKT